MSQIDPILERFVTSQGQLRAIPRKQGARLVLLQWLARQVVGPDESLSEAELGRRLRRFHQDVAMLRRYMVDYAVLERDPNGQRYRLAGEDSPSGPPPANTDQSDHPAA